MVSILIQIVVRDLLLLYKTVLDSTKTVRLKQKAAAVQDLMHYNAGHG